MKEVKNDIDELIKLGQEFYYSGDLKKAIALFEKHLMVYNIMKNLLGFLCK